MDNKSNQLL